MHQTKNKSIFFCMLSLAVVLHACKQEIIVIEPEVPFNPFDTLTYENGVIDETIIDSNSFLGLHTFIFKPTCAIPACHDGSFEPDFRTVQSAYNTLVYHPVIKNDEDENYSFRVVPGDTTASWLYERITTDDATLGQMPLYDTLTKPEMQTIIDWIANGAQDVMGNSPVLTDFNFPQTGGFLAYHNDTTGSRLDDNRDFSVAPMKLPAASNVEIWLSVYDFDADSNFYWGNVLSYNKARISDDAVNFTDYDEYTMEVELASTPYIGPVYWDSTYTTYYYQHFTFNTSGYIPGKLYFIRFYVKDIDHTDPTEIPDAQTNPYILTYFSFIVE
ncbi:MAG: hypothetical protein ACKVPJ_04480 [Chitinophagales bacterium]